MNAEPSVYAGLEEASAALAAAARRRGVTVKQDVLYSLSCGLVTVSRAVQQISQAIGEAGYGPEVRDPVDATASAVFAASVRAEEALHAVGSLMNIRVGDLAASGRQVPDHAELNGGS